ncbi:hypothetical protein EAS64_40170 [Trebonia kvetii]|uniref:Heavy metal-binding domain-containing protein n=1 Tax=Trebonia kvetii TaxID=2480626 RepID=A0A6P2BLH6_9ACTN|nr:hypothetical protein EAS64_40170 [Trebonia kvetii]
MTQFNTTRNRLERVSDERSAAEQAAGSSSGGTWGSVLTCQELAAVGGVGFTPVGQVFGAAVYAADYAGGSQCPGAAAPDDGMPVPPAAQGPEVGDPDGFGPLVEAMYQARRTAVDRMAAQCDALGGHGVVGVRFSRGPFVFGGLGFTVAGTAVRATGNAVRPRRPFIAGVSGQDFARLVMSGWIPAGLAHGIAIGALHDDRATVRQARPWSGNAEMAGWTAMVNRARRGARHRLEDDIRRLGAEGAVIAGMQMHAHVRDCPVAVGRRDHIVEVTLIGTAIVSFSRADRPPAGPVVTVTPLGTPPYQPVWARNL